MRALRHTGARAGVWAPRTGVVAGARAAMAKAGGADLDLREAKASRRPSSRSASDSALVRLEARVKRDYAITAGIVGAGGTVASLVVGCLERGGRWRRRRAVALGRRLLGLLRAQRSESELVALALERRLDAVSASREPALRTPSMARRLGKIARCRDARPRRSAHGPDRADRQDSVVPRCRIPAFARTDLRAACKRALLGDGGRTKS